MKIIKMIGILFILTLLVQSVYGQEISEEEAFQVAKEAFNELVPLEVRNEYRTIGIQRERLNPSEYVVEWWRHINNIPVEGDRVIVRIDAKTGKVLSKDFTYSYSASELDTDPSMTKWQATQLALTTYGGELVEPKEKNPLLMIQDKNLLWMILLKFEPKEGDIGEPTLLLGLDADTGETKFFTSSKGFNVQQLPTSFTPPWYQPLLLHPEYAVVAIIAIAGVSVYLIKNKKLAL